MAKKTLQDTSSLPSAIPPPKSFEQAMSELERLVVQMEGGELPLEASVTAYRRGAELVQFCTAQLERVDQQVKILEGEVQKPMSSALSAQEDDQ